MALDRLAGLAPAVAAAVALIGALRAAAEFPGGYDWQYMAMSTLASARHNPSGGWQFALALAASLLVLWPVTMRLATVLPCSAGARRGIVALRGGLILGMLTGIESLLSPDLPVPFDRLHEALAVLAYTFLYAGTVAVCVVRIRVRTRRAVPWLLLSWYTVLGAVLLYLFLGQREFGWVGRHWREIGIPPWRSFAAWQWVACASVLVAFAYFAWAWRRPQAVVARRAC